MEARRPRLLYGSYTMLKAISSMLQSLRSYFASIQARRDDAYLSGAVDLCELERRQRELDRQCAIVSCRNDPIGMGPSPGR